MEFPLDNQLKRSLGLDTSFQLLFSQIHTETSSVNSVISTGFAC